MTDTATVEAELASFVGQVAVTEFRAARECYHDELLTFARTLPILDDIRLQSITESAIFSSALMSGFRGNHNHVHFKATACFHECQRRHRVGGHRDDCAHDIYTRAHDAVMMSQGYEVRTHEPCTCQR